MSATCITCLTTLLLLILKFNCCCGHVVLTYPPARTFSTDGSWASKTKCPVSKGVGPKTSLIAGSVINVTWQSSYPHIGGFKLEVLDPQDRPIMDLTPIVSGNKFISLDPTVENYEVRVPFSVECINCAIRLLHQATEWNPEMAFASCADVDLIKPESYQETCMQRGSYNDGHCTCQKTFSGSQCQYKDECLVDLDCGSHGRCIDIGGTSYPRKQCYCEAGWFGRACEKVSALKSIPLDLNSHNRQDLADNVFLYWRLLFETGEIEMVIVANSDSYVAVGWRSNNVTAECKNVQPIIGERRAKQLDITPDELTTISSTTTELSTTKEAQLLTTSRKRIRFPSRKTTQTTTETTTAITTETAATSVVFSTYSNSSVSISEAVSVLTPNATNENSQSITTTNKPTTSTSAMTSLSTEEKSASSIKIFTSEKISTSVVTRESEQPLLPPPSTDTAIATSSNIIEETSPTSQETTVSEEFSSVGSQEAFMGSSVENTMVTSAGDYSTSGSEEHVTSVEVKSYIPAESRRKRHMGHHSSHDSGHLHPMDCADVVIGSARGNLGRVGDFYSKDESTPLPDESLNGSDDLTAALAYEVDGVTFVAFRKKLIGDDQWDHSIEDAPMHFIWARGQPERNYSHEPPVTFEETGRPFYARDELKYHGTSQQRGVTKVHFYQEVRKEVKRTYHGEWKTPGDCHGNGCEYHASWEFDPNTDDINFTIFTKHSTLWTGIGFSRDQLMNNTDAIIGWVQEDGRNFMMDMWINGYSAPLLDGLQNVENQAGTRNESGTTLHFSRKRDTGDNLMDLAFRDDECLYMIFPYQGGYFNAVNKKLRKHEKTPAVSTKKMCINASGQSFSSSPTSETVETVETIETASAGPVPAATLQTFTPTPLKTTIRPTAPSMPAYNVSIALPTDDRLQKTLELDSDKVLLVLKEKIRGEMTNLLMNVTGFREVVMGSLESESNASTANYRLIATVYIIVDKTEFSEHNLIRPVRQALREGVAEGKIWHLPIDEKSIIIEDPKILDDDYGPRADDVKSSFDEKMVAIYAVITAVSALGLLIFVQIVCTIYRSRHMKHARMSKEQLITNSGWKDYSTGSANNYNYEPFSPMDSEPSSSRKKNVSGSGPTKSSTPEIAKSIPRHAQHLNNGRRSESLSRLAPTPSSGRGGFTNAYATHDRVGSRENGRGGSPPRFNRELQPDFYFMPSQRRYTGDVIRVSVDYNNPNYSGK